MFRAINSPVLRGTFDCIYSFWYNAPTLLPTSRQQCRCIVPKAVCTVKSAPEDGRIYHPKHVGLILKRSINGICCILLVAYMVGSSDLYYYHHYQELRKMFASHVSSQNFCQSYLALNRKLSFEHSKNILLCRGAV
jgi:hypothetical protein